MPLQRRGNSYDPFCDRLLGDIPRSFRLGVRLWSFLHLYAGWFAGTLDAGSAPHVNELLTHTLGAADSGCLHFIDDGDGVTLTSAWPLTWPGLVRLRWRRSARVSAGRHSRLPRC